MSLVFSDWRLMARLVGASLILLAAFLFGVWLTQPSFPTDRKFASVSLNGDSLLAAGTRNAPTFEAVRQSPFLFSAEGATVCGNWGAELVLTGTRWIAFRKPRLSEGQCPSFAELETKFTRALLGATRWRREGGSLILENDTNVLRLYPTYR